ncbi:unnamed protein product [Phytomonas sp. Hart1]|nr:unnamed protein product [Phytomonas sp. Hart1]|eukprot:CCW67741.1 unnamed protein product [Phytomonas sp. isolate Hart1]
MKESSLNSRDPLVLATAYYPTVFTSASSTKKVPINSSSSLPTASSTGSVNELNLKDVVPYLRHLSLSSEHVIYKPLTALQLSNIPAKTCKQVLDTNRPVPTITLAVETGPFAFNFRYINEVSEADKIGKLCPPDPVELDGISTEVAEFKPDVEESYWEGEFWRALTAAQDTGHKKHELMKQSRLRSQRLLALSRASVSSVMGSPTLNFTATPLSSQVSKNSTPMSNSLELNNISSFNSVSLSRVYHPSCILHNSVTSTPSATIDQFYQKKMDTDAVLATPTTTTAQRNAKGFLRRARFNEKQRVSSFITRKNMTLQSHDHSSSYVIKSFKGTSYRENSYSIDSEKRGFKVLIPSIASESSFCLDANSFVESIPTSALATCVETPIANPMSHNSTSLHSSPLNPQKAPVNDVTGIPTHPSYATTTLSCQDNGIYRDSTVNRMGEDPVEGGQSRPVPTADTALSGRTGETAAVCIALSNLLSKREPREVQDHKSSSEGKLQLVQTSFSHSTIKRDNLHSKQFLNNVRSTPVDASGSALLDSPSLKRLQLASLNTSFSQRTSQPSAATDKYNSLSNLIKNSSIHPGCRSGESPKVRVQFIGADTAALAIEDIECVLLPNKSGSKVLHNSPDQIFSEEHNIRAIKGSDQISSLPPESDSLKLSSKLQGSKPQLRVTEPCVCLDNSQSQSHQANSQAVHSNTEGNGRYFLHRTKPSKAEKNTSEGRRPSWRTIESEDISSQSTPKSRLFRWKKLATGNSLPEDARLPNSTSTQAAFDDHVSPLVHSNINGASIVQNDTNVHRVLTPSSSPLSALPSQLLNSKLEGKHNCERLSCDHRGTSLPSLSVNLSARDIHSDPLNLCQPMQSFRKGDTPGLVNDDKEGLIGCNKDADKHKNHPFEAKTGEARCCVVM